jgi:hypothetical protein
MGTSLGFGENGYSGLMDWFPLRIDSAFTKFMHFNQITYVYISCNRSSPQEVSSQEAIYSLADFAPLTIKHRKNRSFQNSVNAPSHADRPK